MSGIRLGNAGRVPIVNFGPFLDGSNKQDVADAMLASFQDIGFVYLVNHGLPKEKIDGMFEWVSEVLYVIGTLATLISLDVASPSPKGFSYNP